MSTSNEKKEKWQVAGFNAATCGLAFWWNFSTRRKHSLANSKEKNSCSYREKKFETRHESKLSAQNGKLEVWQFWNKEPNKSLTFNHKSTSKRYRLQLRPSKLVEEHEFGYVDTSQMIARLAISVCQYFNARIEKKLSEPTSYRSLIISNETLMEDFKPRPSEKDEFE